MSPAALETLHHRTERLQLRCPDVYAPENISSQLKDIPGPLPDPLQFAYLAKQRMQILPTGHQLDEHLNLFRTTLL